MLGRKVLATDEFRCIEELGKFQCPLRCGMPIEQRSRFLTASLLSFNVVNCDEKTMKENDPYDTTVCTYLKANHFRTRPV